MEEPKPIVYLAYPIDQASDWFPSYSLIRVLMEAGCTVYNPKAAWNQVNGQPGIQEVNQAAIDASDGVLALLPDGVPTVGTPIEIAYAAERHKPVVVFGSARIAKSPILASLEVPVYDTDAMAIARLLEWMNNSREKTVPVDETPPTAFGTHTTNLDEHLPYLRAVLNEINRAAEKFPLSDRNGFDDWFAIWVEEVVEAIQAYNDWRRTLKESGPGIEASEYHNALLIELVQVGAMAARFFESLSE